MDKVFLEDRQPAASHEPGEVVDSTPSVKPEIISAIQLAGDVTPVPWAGIAANALILALTTYGSVRGRKWRKAAVSAVQAGNEFRQVAKQVAPEKYQEVKNRIIGTQNADGTRYLIKRILNAIS